MVSDIISGLNNKFFIQLYRDTLGYFSVYEYLKLRYKAATKSKITINSLQDFWSRILRDNFVEKDIDFNSPLENGQVIELKDFFMSDFAPKIPGQIWTQEGMQKFRDGTNRQEGYKVVNDKVYLVLNPTGKKQVLEAGLGSIRINPSLNSDKQFMYMSLTSIDLWKVDFGIPVVVSKSVYNEYLKYASSGGVYVEKIEGILYLNFDLPISKIITPALGANIPKELEDKLKLSCFLPKCFVYVGSPLNISFKYHTHQPDCIAWTMFESSSPKEKYMYSYIEFNPKSNDSIRDAVNFLNFYVNTNNGEKIICDFDGMVPRLQAEIPLNTNPIVDNKIEAKRVLKYAIENIE